MEKSERANLAFTTGAISTRRKRPKRHATAAFWGPTQAQHLLMRAAFGASLEETLEASVAARDDMIDHLLEDKPLPPPPGDWVSEPYQFRGLSQEERREKQRQNRVRFRELIQWWISLMLSDPYGLREKMTLFWHGHFVVEAAVVKVAQYLYIYNDMLRRNALGNFRAFVKEIYKDPAMLIYLNGLQNNKLKPNENFARELLELFTMGVDNYTEQDIKEASRAFTGWRINHDILKPYYFPLIQDTGSKTFLGQTGNFDGDDIVDIIFEQPVTANFICEKLYKYFVSPEVNEERVNALAGIFRNSDYEIKPVLREIFTSDYFYGEENVGAIIKSPIHLVVSLSRHFSRFDADSSYLYASSNMLDQSIFSPPNVAGWAGQRNWISPITLPTRGEFGEAAVMGGRIDRPNANRNRVNPVGVDAMAFARSFGIDHPRELLDKWVEHLLPISIDETTKELLLDILMEGAAEEDWSLDYPGVDDRVKRCLAQLLRLPEYQLT